MRTNNVLVAENPVSWKTLVRLTDNEPPNLTSEDNDLAPFYMGNGDNSHFSDNEKQALQKVACKPGMILTKVVRVDGRVSYVELDREIVGSFFDNNAAAELRLIADFLSFLGGTGDVRRRQREATEESERTQRKTNMDGAAQGKKGGMGVEQDKVKECSRDSESDNYAHFESKNPDFEAAAKLLNTHGRLQEEFSALLRRVRNGDVKKESRTYKFRLSESSAATCKTAIEVGVKYHVFDLKVKNSLLNDLKKKKMIESYLEWEISFE